MATNKHKLNPAAKQLVISRIIGGDNDAEVREALHNAGYPPVTQQAIDYYRDLPEVKHGLRQLGKENLQAGLGMNARRIALISKQIKGILAHFESGYSVMEKQEVEENGRKTFKMVEVFKPFGLETRLQVGMVIAKLVDSLSKLTTEAERGIYGSATGEEEEGSASSEVRTLTPGQISKLFNDGLELWMRKEGILKDTDVIDPRLEQINDAE